MRKIAFAYLHFFVVQDELGINDIGAENFKTLNEITYTWQKRVKNRIYFSLHVSDTEAISYYSRVSSGMSLSTVTRMGKYTVKKLTKMQILPLII